MSKILLLCVMFFLHTSIHAQTRETDSLNKLLQNEKTDTGRVLRLADLSFAYIESDADTMMKMALQALELSIKIGFEKGEATSLNRIGNAFYALGNYPKAMEVFLQALQINEKINHPDGKQRNLGNIGLLYREQGDYRQALDYTLKATAIAEQINNKKSLANNLVNVAAIYESLKIFDSARLYAQQSNDVASQINYTRLIGSSLFQLGSINFETGQTNLALEYYRLSIPYLKTSVNDFDLSKTYLGMGKLFEKTQHKDSALFYAKQALLIANEKKFLAPLRDAADLLSYYYREYNADSAFYYRDVSEAANDSLFSRQKQKQFQSLAFDEKLRQNEINAAALKAKEERNHNLQYAAIAVAIISFLILFFTLSRSIIVKEKFIEFFGVLALLAVFEFINLFIHPYLANATNHSPVLMLLLLIEIGALLVPLHHRMEKWITNRMVEKNKMIRLAAAKKTIAALEGENK